MTAYTAAMPLGYESSRYPNLARVLAPELASLSDTEIRLIMEHRYGRGAAEHYEDYFEGIFGDIGKAFSSAAKDVGRFAKKAAPAVAEIGGGALKGALAGAALGPIGMIGGAALGGAGAGLSKFGKGTAKDIGGVLGGVTGIAGQFSPLGRIGAAAGSAISGLAGPGGIKNAAGAALGALGSAVGGAGGGKALGALGGLLGGSKGGAGLGALTSLFGGGNATTQLLSLLQRPETMQALGALSLGPAGRRSIPVGAAQTPVPASAITNLIGQLANQASAEAAVLGDGAEAELVYMTNEAGEFVGDPALDRDRAARLWDLLNQAQAERLEEALAREQSDEAFEERVDEGVDEASDEVDEMAYYEAIELADAESLDETYDEQADETFDEWYAGGTYGYA